MQTINIIFPHQLFKESPLLENDLPVFLVEEHLFFKQYNFHKQKLAFHRASMKFYESYLKEKGKEVHYIEASDSRSDIRVLLSNLSKEGHKVIHFIDPTDDWLSKRIKRKCEEGDITMKEYPSLLFLNSKEDLSTFFKPEKKKFFQTSFYISERKKRNILIEGKDQPVGGKWSFDKENRKKYPKGKLPPPIFYPKKDEFAEEAIEYVTKNFKNNLGKLELNGLYPNDFKSSQNWLIQFLKNRFAEFGTYEDAIVAEYGILNHSVLTPMLNVGLITPQEIIDTSINFAIENDIPLNSLEGFVRQIMGWREFIRGMYEVKGVQQRTTNYWNFKRKIPASFYDGTTGIPPIDQTIKKVLNTGYCHHIERLMILGNFMLLCEFDPDEVYQWFMELFIDAYDWVMVPNVYGMSQFADGGLLATKPYISGSNYILKMSNYKKGSWQKTWDGLFWRFMSVHRDFFLSNPRLGMLVRTFDRMSVEKQEEHFKNAEAYLMSLEQGKVVVV